ncbi:MAG TPA: ester cyclase [Candidatus Kapabacteria bacterium]|nr:ester cyclase [Candidatus Kapabacteria bacterium]
MSLASNKEVARQFVEDIWGKGDLNLAEQLIAADVVDNNPMPGLPPGRDGHNAMLTIVRAAFPDATFTLDQVVAEDDKVVDHWTMRATHAGPFMGIPATGRPVVLRGVDILRIENGQIAEFWHIEDIVGVLGQLGVLPPPKP